MTLPQESVAVAAAKVTTAEQFPASLDTLILSGQVITGAVESSMVKVAVVVVSFPQASVAVKVTSSNPVAPQASLKPVLSLDQVTPEQESDALAPPLFVNHAANAPAGSAVPSHSTVLFAATAVKVGAVVSSTFIVCTMSTLVSLQGSVTV